MGATAVLVLAGQPGQAATPAAQVCPQVVPAAELGRVTRLRAQGRTVRVVVLGSSSTAGAGASRPELGYVAQLAHLLRGAWGADAVTVFNRGVGGDTLTQELARRERDVYALSPDLVIVQTGMNDVLQNASRIRFERDLHSFLKELRGRGLDVLLVNVQYVERLKFSPSYHLMREIIQAVGRFNHVGVLSRYDLTRALIRQTGASPASLSASDGLHPNDLMHWCTAQALSQTIIQGSAGR
ncbi:SGNH/GDSL hydrolase family protein [Deinococcus petrolearius]|uniref:SGNH/GDSL hydrolase family protein n=1 Tax=Deinococcus petrolearius TaxID=1751295 RepID=A0ABW1DL40_9DEIO